MGGLLCLWYLCDMWEGGVGLLEVVRLLMRGVAEGLGEVLVGEVVGILGWT